MSKKDDETIITFTPGGEGGSPSCFAKWTPPPHEAVVTGWGYYGKARIINTGAAGNSGEDVEPGCSFRSFPAERIGGGAIGGVEPGGGGGGLKRPVTILKYQTVVGANPNENDIITLTAKRKHIEGLREATHIMVQLGKQFGLNDKVVAEATEAWNNTGDIICKGDKKKCLKRMMKKFMRVVL